ncbi:MAG: hypothetical protein CV082_01870 [Candidatus Brocadia sp. BL1]|nr:MAG: hypothetical protein B6D34_04270 [Candidatus Brocadia sp. UTAMX1]TVL98157.1 MAG: hypothetical protein CV082_01870 [Candidatus Brocadia sp. BL1]
MFLYMALLALGFALDLVTERISLSSGLRPETTGKLSAKACISISGTVMTTPGKIHINLPLFQIPSIS